MNAQLLMVAAGLGRRLGLDTPKALADLCGQSLAARTLDTLASVGLAPPAIIVYPKGYKESFQEALKNAAMPVQYVEGGAERRDSVRRGLDALNPDTDIVVIHDAARPFANADAVRAAIEAANHCGAATLATPVADTVLVSDGDGYLDNTPDRALLWACQTPQVFRTSVIRQAHDDVRNRDIVGTDDATLARRIGCRVKLVDGGAMNFKITTRRDLAFATYALDKGMA